MGESEFQQAVDASGLGGCGGEPSVADVLDMMRWSLGKPATDTPGFIESLEARGANHVSYD